jgi:Domain of unknown function (DUF4395)
MNAAGGARRNFILQQGFEEPPAETCSLQYSALQFQPRVVALGFLLGVVLQSPVVFFALGAVLWWNALFPQWNPFDAVHNRILGRRAAHVLLTLAPPPRRFAQGMAGTFSLAIGVSLSSGWRAPALVLEVLMGLAVGALAFGGFCLGSFVFHLLRGRWAFAVRTLPWARGR